MKTRQEEEADIKKRLRGSDSSHWYDQKGAACHEIEMKSKPGQFRNVTKTDAAKKDLLPSVTNVLSKCDPKPGLDDWKRNLLFQAMYDNMDLFAKMFGSASAKEADDFSIHCKRLDTIAFESSKGAANVGSMFHLLMEILTDWYILGVTKDFDDTQSELMKRSGVKVPMHFIYVSTRIFGEVAKMLLPWNDMHKNSPVSQEFNIVWNQPLPHGSRFGLGGKFDLLIQACPQSKIVQNLIMVLDQNGPEFKPLSAQVRARSQENLPINILLDWKTRKPTRAKRHPHTLTFPAYNTDAAQLAAYGEGLKMSDRCIPVHVHLNLLVASDVLSLDHSASPPEFKEFSDLFQARFYTNDQIEAGVELLESSCMIWKNNEKSSHLAKKNKGGKTSMYIPQVLDDDEAVS